MDKQQWYVGQLVTQGEMNDAFDNVELADQNLVIDHDSWGIMSGLQVTATGTPDNWVHIADGVAYDELGQRIEVDDGPVDIDLTNYIPAGAGDETYVAIYVEFDRFESDPRIDKFSNPLNYLHDESYDTYLKQGSEGAPPQSKPGLEANKVLLCVVHLYQGMGSVQNSDISMSWLDEIYQGVEVDRQIGGVAAPGHALGDTQQLAYDSGVGEVIQVGPSNYIDCRTGSVRKASRIEANEPDPAANQGFLYVDPLTATKIEVPKAWDIPAASMLPEGGQATPPWYSGAAQDNVWTVAGGTRNNIEWECKWDGTAYGSAREGEHLIAPIYVPDRCQIDKITIWLEVLFAFPADLDFVIRVMKRYKFNGTISTHCSHTYNVGSGGIWSATGIGHVIALETPGDSEIDVLNDDGTNIWGYTYYVDMYYDDASGVGSESYVDIFGGTINALIRDASHVY